MGKAKSFGGWVRGVSSHLLSFRGWAVPWRNPPAHVISALASTGMSTDTYFDTIDIYALNTIPTIGIEVESDLQPIGINVITTIDDASIEVSSSVRVDYREV